MKRILLFLSALFIATTAIAHTINWYVDGSVYHTTTCESGENVTPPTAPEKYGYTFKGWVGNYTEVEYLESTGTQWIDTGFIPNEDIILKLEVSPKGLDENGILGNVWAVGSPLLIFYQNKIRWHMSTGTGIDSDIITNPNANHIIEAYNGVLIVDGKEYTGTKLQTLRDNSSLKLFFFKNGLQTSVVKIYYFQIYDNDTLVHNFIPVLDSDGVPCMHDLVEHKFYYNAGTGDFIAGPIVGE